MRAPSSILVIGNGPEVSRLRSRLATHFLTVESVRTLAESRSVMQRCRFHALLLVDPDEPWGALRGALKDCDGLPPGILLIADKSRAAHAVEALRGGVSDVLMRPFSNDDLVASVVAVCEGAGSGLRAPLGRPGPTLVGESAAMREIRTLVERLGPTAVTVLIEGEPGTGRKLLAELLHEQSGGAGPFTVVDCRTARTAALTSALARHDAAGGTGTLFFDAIDALPLDLQAELLRNMPGRAGAAENGPRAASRMVASTHTDLAELVARHRFHEDLWQRLRVMRIGLPPLRERRADIPLLAAHFADRLSAEMGRPPVEFQPEELDALWNYDWPGNVAELRLAIEQTLLRGQLPADALVGSVVQGAPTPDYPLDWTLEQVKRHHMACVLEDCAGNKSAAARRLDISRKTLDRKLGARGHE